MTSEQIESVNYLCEICGKVLENVKLLSNHRAIHNENLSSCKESDKSFKNNTRMTRHVNRFHEGNSAHCPIYSQSFTSKANIVNHIRSSHEKTISDCQICKKMYPVRSLSKHEKLCRTKLLRNFNDHYVKNVNKIKKLSQNATNAIKHLEMRKD